MTVRELRELLFKIENQDIKVIFECNAQEYDIDDIYTDDYIIIQLKPNN